MNFRKKLYHAISACTWIIFMSADSSAQDSLVKDLKEITISATKSEKDIFEAARSVSIITSDDIRMSTYQSLAEILSQEAGIYIPGTGQTPGSNQSLFLRGANSNQIVIFINGIRISDASTVNNTIDLSEISIQDIEKIEILRGSHSTLYGSSAIGGVINISTNKHQTKGVHSKGGFSTGTFGSGTSILNPFAEAGYQFSNGIFINGMMDYSTVKGLDATIDTITDPMVFKNRDKDDWKKLNTNFNLGYYKNKMQARVNYRYSESETSIDKSAFQDDDNYLLNFNRSTASCLLSREFKAGTKLSLNGGVSWNERHALNDSSQVSDLPGYDHQYAEDTYTGQTSNFDLVLERKQKHWALVAGLARTSEAMTSENYLYSVFFSSVYEYSSSLNNPKPETVTSSLYAQIDINGTILSQQLEKLNLVAGTRYDVNDIFKEQISYELNPSWKLSKRSLLYFTYSTGYNSPSLYQLYANSSYTPWDGSTASGITLGNKLLEPEKSICAEIGFKQKIKSTGQLSLAAFKRRVKNNIEYAYLWNGSIQTDMLGSDFNRDDYRGDSYLNVGTSTTYGVELSLQFQLLESLRCSAGLSLLESQTVYSKTDELPSKFDSIHIQLYTNGQFLNSSIKKQNGLIRRPNIARAELIYTGIKKIRAQLTTQFVEDREDVFYDTQIKPQGALNTISVEKYVLLDFTLSYTLGKYVQFSTRLENLLNEHYSEIRGFSTRGRGVYFKVTYQL